MLKVVLLSLETALKIKVDDNQNMVAYTTDDWISWTGRIPSDDDEEWDLVRRQDVIELIDSRLDQVYEEENNASAEQEMATAEMLMKLLEDVREKSGDGE